jgi:hypothetical protein
MPQQKQPTSLFWTCAFKVSKMIQDAGDRIYEATTTSEDDILFSNSEVSTQMITEVQHYFCDPLPYLLLEMISNQRHLNAHIEKPHATQKLQIFLRIIMHKNLTIFHIPRLSMLPYQLSSIPDSFWCQTLSGMNKLQYLNLSNICTDELLKVIGDSCPLLEDIKIVSKSRNMSAEFNFNALRKAYHVTDIGLLALTKCKKLKIISLGIARVHNRQITPTCIAKMLKELPDLRFINYPHMNMALQLLDAPQQLKLQHITDQYTSIQNVTLYLQHCPYLQHLHLELSKAGDVSKETQHKQTSLIMHELKTSGLKLKRLVLSSFWVTPEDLIQFLSEKGFYLSELVLDSKSCEVDARILIEIGRLCPFLTHLVIKHLETGDFSGHIPSGLFLHLQNLSFVSKDSWNVSQLLSIFFQGGRLAVVNIDIYYNLSDMNNFFKDYFCKNQLPFLRKVVFGGNAVITQSTIESFYKRCPQLKFFMCRESLVQFKRASFLDDLRDDIANNNYDLDMYIYE